VFLASYQWLDGACGSFQGNTFKVQSDDKGTVTRVENRLSDTLTTQVILKGCTIAVKQSVEMMGTKLSEIEGDLHVQDKNALSGMMTRIEYMPDGAIRCHAVYDARYTRQDVIVGGAVQHADLTP
jgi:hypothetical protein